MMRAHSVGMVIGIAAAGCGSPDRLAPDAADVAADASTCVPLPVVASGRIVAPTLAAAPQIDGVLDDWPTCFLPLHHANAALVRSLAMTRAYPNGVFSIARHGDAVYVAAVITGVAPLGDDTTNIRNNDNIEVYLDGDGQTMIGYGTDAREIVVDHAGRLQGFRAGQPVDVGELRRAVIDRGGLYTVELELTPAAFHLDAFASTVGFDFGISDGDGERLRTELVWTKQCISTTAECSCFIGDDAPYCDSRQFGRVVFTP